MPRSASGAAPRRKTQRGLRIAIAADARDWHVKQLVAAFARKGVEAVPTKLAACGFDTRCAAGVTFKGFGFGLPHGLFVRTIGAGTFEEITLRLGIMHALGQLGVAVQNSAGAVERCVDKAATSFLLGRHGIPTPPTWTVQSRLDAQAIVRREIANGPIVIKPLFGAQGRGIKLVRRPRDLPAPEDVAGVYYLQRFVGMDRGGFSDIRVLVSNHRIVAAMRRRALGWVTNVKLGGQPEAYIPSVEEADLALRAVAAVGADFAGVDLIHGSDGRVSVLEVNSMPGWRGLQSVTKTPIADVLARDFLAAVGTSAPAAISA